MLRRACLLSWYLLLLLHTIHKALSAGGTTVTATADVTDATDRVRQRKESYSQWGQDKIIIDHVFGRDKRDGVFVEIGAHNGIDFSNTLVSHVKCVE
jgi:hypothetical protein